MTVGPQGKSFTLARQSTATDAVTERFSTLIRPQKDAHTSQQSQSHNLTRNTPMSPFTREKARLTTPDIGKALEKGCTQTMGPFSRRK